MNPVKEKGKPYSIVAIGASAGGLKAIIEILDNLPANTGMAYFYIQHLDREAESNLSSILERHTAMKVHLAEDLMKINPNELYIIPPNKEMILIDGVVKLEPRPADRQIHLPIDRFFYSLAEKQKEGSVGVILSGAASDGAAGLKAIKMAGGLTFAQNESAEFQSMPKSAVAEGAVDLVLSPKEIAIELSRLGRHGDVLALARMNADDDTYYEEDKEIKNVLQLIQKSTGVDFNEYKISTVRRRIIRRMLINRLENLKQYVQYLKANTKEINLLYSDMLINVTAFFREAETLDYLEHILIPKLLETKDFQDPLRIWIPACSTGEECYTVAIIVSEIISNRNLNIPVQIFATDLSETALSKARQGAYAINDVANISEDRLNRFFVKVDGSYRIIKKIRDTCVFAQHNILRDPPFSKIDLVSCCNLLIYFNPMLQKKVMATFHYSLKNTGYLVLGRSENIADSTALFTQAEKKVKVFAKNDHTSSVSAVQRSLYNTQGSEKILPVQPLPVEQKISPGNLEKIVDHLFLKEYVPASVVINHNHEILQFRGPTSQFLEPATGTASLSILKMVPSAISFELRTAIDEVIKTGKQIRKNGMQVKRNAKNQTISFEVTPLRINSQEPLLLILFQDHETQQDFLTSQTDEQLIKQLEAEIILLREDMRSTLEKAEIANEELQSANEEIVSSNEELQSLNEELETSKEELESSNEELITTNQELLARNDQLAESLEYSDAVFKTIRESLLVLDGNLRVRSANQCFYNTFKTSEQETEGRLLYDLGNGQWDIPKLRLLLEEIIPKDKFFSGFEVTHEFPAIGPKIMLLNAMKLLQKTNSQELLLLAIEDITEYKHAQKVLSEQQLWLRNLADTVPAMIWVLGRNRELTFVNKTWLAFTGKTLQDELNNGWLENIHKEDVGQFIEQYQNAFNKREPFQIEFRMKRFDGQFLWVLCNSVPTYSSESVFTGFTASCIEIHNKKIMNDELEKRVNERTTKLQEAIHDLQNSNHELEQFAWIASHDLQEPLRKVLTFSDRLENQYLQNLPEQGKVFLKKIIESSQRMTQLIDDLLNFSRITQITKGFVQTDLNSVISNVLPDFDLIVKEKKAQIICGRLPQIEANRVQMNQLFHNLFSNSLKFTKEDTSPVIEIQCRQLTKEQHKEYKFPKDSEVYYQITFRDNGIGFSQEYASQVFTIFQRLHEKSRFSGTGIGLALCQKIVENHRGVIYAESREADGATFYIILPAKQPS